MKPTPDQIARALRGKVQGRVLADAVTRRIYATDASVFRIVPAVVVEPRSYEDVAAVVTFARDHGIGIAPRGAGTGLAGESLTEGIVLDFSVHFTAQQLLAPDLVRVQPGVVHARLNSELQRTGKIFGPDPSTGNRCTLGGMIGNNATGAHSLKYRMTADWVRALTVMRPDGTVERFAPRICNEGEEPQGWTLLERDLLQLLRAHAPEIEATRPRSPRNRHGYALDKVLQGGHFDITRLFCGSEGTLGIVLEADLAVSDLPRAVGLIALTFDDRLKAAEATPALLPSKPVAIELIDGMCLGLARKMPVYADLYPAAVQAILLVEFEAASQESLDAQIRGALRSVEATGLALGHHICRDHAERKLRWEMRSHISGMLNRMPGRMQPAALIEDVSVPPEQLARYLAGVDTVLRKRGLQHLCFGHAGDGTVHVRPLVDTTDPATWEWLPELCGEIYDLTLSLGGSISGEHGDGLLRGPYMRKQYGDLVDVFKKVKTMLDPQGIFNPGKKADCDGFEAWRSQLRFLPPETHVSLPGTVELQRLRQQVEACNGCGACRASSTGRMCPMFRAVGTEIASSRAKANIMRALLAGDLGSADAAKLREAAEYCINCKTCALECPAGVSAGDLMTEMKTYCREVLGAPLDAHALGHFERTVQFAGRVPGLVNIAAGNRVLRKAGEQLTGVSAQRQIPPFAPQSLFAKHRTLRRGPAAAAAADVPRVVYFADVAAGWMNVEVGEALLQILEHNGVEVLLPEQDPSGIVQMSYGDARQVRRLARRNIARLDPYVRAGYAIVCSEPSGALMLKHEYPEFVPGEQTARVAGAVWEAIGYLHMLRARGLLKTDFSPLALHFGYHEPCHLKVLQPAGDRLALLTAIPQLKLTSLNEGCCGLAGTFGMRRKNFATSMQIGSKLFERLAQPEFDYGLTECAACRMQMEQGVPGKKTLHPLTVLAAGYGLTLMQQK